MRSEHFMLVALWLIGIVAFIVLIPRSKRREGIFAFITFKAFIWLFDMPIFEWDWLNAPVRELPKASELPITIHYFLYPALFAIYYTRHNPKDSRRARALFLFSWVAIVSLFDLAIERYTDLLQYTVWPSYGMWIYIGILFTVSHACCHSYYNRAINKTSRKWTI